MNSSKTQMTSKDLRLLISILTEHFMKMGKLTVAYPVHYNIYF